MLRGGDGKEPVPRWETAGWGAGAGEGGCVPPGQRGVRPGSVWEGQSSAGRGSLVLGERAAESREREVSSALTGGFNYLNKNHPI